MPRIRRKPALCFLCSLILLPVTVPTQAEIYTWHDESGQQRFSDRPPEATDYQRWQPPENPNSDLQLPEPRDDWPDRSTREDEEESSSSAQSERRRQAERCREYEAELEHINNQLRAGYQEPKGNRLRAERRELRSRQFEECM